MLFERRRSAGTRPHTVSGKTAADTAPVPVRTVPLAACTSADTAEDIAADIVAGIAAGSPRFPVDKRTHTEGPERSPCTAAGGAARRGTLGNRSFCGSTV